MATSGHPSDISAGPPTLLKTVIILRGYARDDRNDGERNSEVGETAHGAEQFLDVAKMMQVSPHLARQCCHRGAYQRFTSAGSCPGCTLYRIPGPLSSGQFSRRLIKDCSDGIEGLSATTFWKWGNASAARRGGEKKSNSMRLRSSGRRLKSLLKLDYCLIGFSLGPDR